MGILRHHCHARRDEAAEQRQLERHREQEVQDDARAAVPEAAADHESRLCGGPHDLRPQRRLPLGLRNPCRLLLWERRWRWRELPLLPDQLQ